VSKSTLYDALEALSRERLVVPEEVRRPPTRSGKPRQARVMYTASDAGVHAFDAWLVSPIREVPPARSEISMRICLSGPEHVPALIELVEEEIQRCGDALAKHLAACSVNAGARVVAWNDAVVWLNQDAGTRRLQTELEWLDRVREAARYMQRCGIVPRDLLAR
jgi:hypothetical protein